MPSFRGFICAQAGLRSFGLLTAGTVCTNDEICCVQTANLRGPCTVELKPKCGLVERAGFPPRFVLAQRHDSGHPKYDPTAIWAHEHSNESLYDSLIHAYKHPKGYLKIHSRTTDLPDTKLIGMVVGAISSSSGQKLLTQLKRLQQLALDEEAQIANAIYKVVGDDVPATDPVDLFPMDEWPSPSEFTAYGERLVSQGLSMNRRQAAQFLNTFLAGRMAMDVSLMFNFFPPARPIEHHAELNVVPLSPDWSFTIGLVDTDLKHRWKIPFYAEQFNNSIR